jgi:hypothetical protein
MGQAWSRRSVLLRVMRSEFCASRYGDHCGTGDYASSPLRPGNYRVVAGAPGFKTQTRSTI